MKQFQQLRRRTLALLLTMALLCTYCISALAVDTWWTPYVSAPMSDITVPGVADGQVTASGPYVLFTSDLHRYTYLVKDLLAAANDTAGEQVGMISFGGDFANEKLVYDDNMSILKAAIASSPGTVATYTKGNHEGAVSDADFAAAMGMSRIGETAVSADGAYYFYNFGAYNDKQAFQADDIAALDTYLAAHNDKPVFIVSHFPLHYYNDRRTSGSADAVVNVLNKYPQAVFLWGHNHTEQDPSYGMIRTAGDVIQTGASEDTTVEINFTYANLGALRDGINEANGLLAEVDGAQVTFQYIDLNVTASDETWTDAQGNENTIRTAGTPAVSSTTVVDTSKGADTTVSQTDVFVARPRVDDSPATAISEYSPRYDASAPVWTTAGNPVAGKFAFNTAYTVAFTLTAASGYLFDPALQVCVDKKFVGPMPGQQNNAATVTVSGDKKTAAVSFTFPKTIQQGGSGLSPTTELHSGGIYVMATNDGTNYAASYTYDPTQHGEESMPNFVPQPADVVIRDGKLISATDAYMLWTAQRDEGGFLLYSDASRKAYAETDAINVLSAVIRGAGEMELNANEGAGASIGSDWYLDAEGRPYISYDGIVAYVSNRDGAFGFTKDAEACNVRLYQLGSTTTKTIYTGAVQLEKPVAGAVPDSTPETGTGAYTVGAVTWTPADKTFAFDTAYTATCTLTPASGYSFATDAAVRIAGNVAEGTLNGDGTMTVTYAFPATEKVPGDKQTVTTAAAAAITDGGAYLIVSDGYAMTYNVVDGTYMKATPVTVQDGKITSAITADMIFTLAGNDTDGYSIACNGNYLALRGKPPETWGMDSTTETDSAALWVYEDGALYQLSVEGNGDISQSYLYCNDGHFNFTAASPAKAVTLYQVTDVLPFNDVTADSWFRDSVIYAYRNNLVQGTSETTFSPNLEMTRAMLVTILYRMEGAPAVSGTTGFADVPAGAYYRDAVLWAQENGLVNGLSATRFAPDGTLTREQLAALLHRYADYKGFSSAALGSLRTYTDAETISAWAYEDMQWAVSNEFMNGTSTTVKQLSPLAATTRAQTVTLIARFLQKLKG